MSTPTTNFKIRPELLVGPPRRAQYTTATIWTRRIYWNFFLAVFCLVYWQATRDIADLHALATRGIVTQGSVTNKWETHGKSTSYTVQYRFCVSGYDCYGDNDSVSQSRYEATAIGSPVTVTYLPGQPDTFREGMISDARIADQRTNWILAILFGSLAFALAGWAMEAYYRGRLHLLREGIAAAGKITGRKIVKGKTDSYYITYTFAGRDNAVRSNTVSVTRAAYEARPEGTPLTILYLPKEAYTNLPYFLLTEATIDGAAMPGE